MRLPFSLFILFIANLSFAQKKIGLKDVSKHIGDTVRVEGKIFDAKTFPDNPKARTLLNLGGDFPNQTLSIAVFPSYKSDVIVMPTEDNKGDIAIVIGKIELYKGKPQIAVRTPEGLRIASGEFITPAKQ